MPTTHRTSPLSLLLHTYERHSLQPNITALSPLPLSPTNPIHLLQIPHPPPRIKQRARPPRLIQQPPQLGQPALSPMPFVLAPPPQPHRLLLVLILARDHQVARGAAALIALRQRALEDARRHAAAHLVAVARQRQQRGAAPQHVGGGRVRVALGRVEEEVAHPRPRNVLVLRRHVREEHARRHVRPRPELRRLLQVRFAQVREAQ
jgi:hypothetical protein